jgi:hypothetical protein
MDKKLINEDIANIKYLFGYKRGRVISEQEQPNNTGYWTQTTTMDSPISRDVSDVNDDYDYDIGKEENELILKKYNLFDEVDYSSRREYIIIENKSSEITKRFISILPLLRNIQLLRVINCEYADFSDVNVCDLPDLVIINLNGTDNNIDKLGYKCVSNEGNNLYYIE